MLAGTIVKSGMLRFRAEKVGADTVLANIIKMVRQAQGSKAPVQRIVDKIALVFVPVVMFIALVTFALWRYVSIAASRVVGCIGTCYRMSLCHGACHSDGPYGRHWKGC